MVETVEEAEWMDLFPFCHFFKPLRHLSRGATLKRPIRRASSGNFTEVFHLSRPTHGNLFDYGPQRPVIFISCAMFCLNIGSPAAGI